MPESEVPNCECQFEAHEGTAETLGELRQRLMIRLGFAAQLQFPPPGMTELLNSFLISEHRRLAERYRDLHTERFFTWNLVEGQRLYGLRGNEEVADCERYFNPRALEWVGIIAPGDVWYPLIEGIPPHLYTADSFLGRPGRYEIRSCIEILPRPDAGPYRLVIKAHHHTLPFTEDGHRTSIHSEVVFLHALGLAKAHYGQRDGIAYYDPTRNTGAGPVLIGDLVAGSHGRKRYVPRSRELGPATPPRFLPLEE